MFLNWETDNTGSHPAQKDHIWLHWIGRNVWRNHHGRLFGPLDNTVYEVLCTALGRCFWQVCRLSISCPWSRSRIRISSSRVEACLSSQSTIQS